jgi:hypothetical protein
MKTATKRNIDVELRKELPRKFIMTDEEIMDLWSSISPDKEVRYRWVLTDFARAIIAVERERCAKKCDEYVSVVGRGLRGDVLRGDDD